MLGHCLPPGQFRSHQLLCSPQNPWGRTYSKEVLLDYALFAEKHDIHLISDEIYALSVWDNPSASPSFRLTKLS